MRFLALLLLVVALLVPAHLSRLGPVASGPAQPRAGLVDALAVLHTWDTRRAEAWKRVDEHALGSLYTSGSEAGRADLHLLRAYRDRGFVVRRLVTQVFAVRVLRRDPTLLRLRVFDRVAGGELVRAGRTLPLRSSRPVIRTLELRLGSGMWRVARVSDSGAGPPAARH
jgi:hypothetical protein